jgi:hypothetical protein
MNVLVNTLIALGVVVLAFDLVVSRLILRKRAGYRLTILGAVCVIAAVLLLWFFPPGPAH